MGHNNTDTNIVSCMAQLCWSRVALYYMEPYLHDIFKTYLIRVLNDQGVCHELCSL